MWLVFGSIIFRMFMSQSLQDPLSVQPVHLVYQAFQQALPVRLVLLNPQELLIFQ